MAQDGQYCIFSIVFFMKIQVNGSCDGGGDFSCKFFIRSNGNVFYIFVLHGEMKNHFLILPFHEMERKVHEKAILEVGHGKRYRVNIKFRNEKVYLGNKDNEMEYFLDNWSLIK